MTNVILGKMFWDALPEEIRAQFPPHTKRFVIDVPYDGAVRVLCEAYGTDAEKVLPLVKAVLKADVEILTVSPVKAIRAMSEDKRKAFLRELSKTVCFECGCDGDGRRCTCMRDD